MILAFFFSLKKNIGSPISKATRKAVRISPFTSASIES